VKKYKITLSFTANKILKHLHPDIKKILRETLNDLSINPYSGKPLKEELEGYWSLPVLKYRVIYQIEKSSIIVIYIGLRKYVYAKFLELLKAIKL